MDWIQAISDLTKGEVIAETISVKDNLTIKRNLKPAITLAASGIMLKSSLMLFEVTGPSKTACTGF